MATEFHDIFTTTTPRRATVKMANSTKLPGINMMTSHSQNAQRHEDKFLLWILLL